MEHLGVVKTLRVAAHDGSREIGKVNQRYRMSKLIHGLNCFVPAILRRSRSLDHDAPSERLGT